MEYSTDTTSWTEWDGQPLSSSKTVPHVLYLRGKNNKQVGGSSGKRFSLNKPVACSGNIMTLLDYENPGTELKETNYGAPKDASKSSI